MTMQLILLEKVRNLGKLGDTITVKRGYGRNYLLPRRKAVLANQANVDLFEKNRAIHEQAEKELKNTAEARKLALEALTITLAAKSGDEGKLFGSIGLRDLANAMTEAGVTVSKSEVQLPEGSIRNIGVYTIQVQLHAEVGATVNVTIVPE